MAVFDIHRLTPHQDWMAANQPGRDADDAFKQYFATHQDAVNDGDIMVVTGPSACGGGSGVYRVKKELSYEPVGF